MKKIIRLTEADLSRIVKGMIEEERKHSPWDEIWYRLRKISSSFELPVAMFENYSYGGLEFFPSGDDLVLSPEYSDPKMWRDDYEEGVEVLERYEKKLKTIFDEFNQMYDLPFKLHASMDPEFKIILSIR